MIIPKSGELGLQNYHQPPSLHGHPAFTQPEAVHYENTSSPSLGSFNSLQAPATASPGQYVLSGTPQSQPPGDLGQYHPIAIGTLTQGS